MKRVGALKKRFGQHFLRDPGVAARIADACALVDGDRTVEIGPGAGALTCHLLTRFPHLDLVEIDRDLIAGLQDRFQADPVTVHEADALRLPFCRALPGRLRVVGNLPYNISSPLIFHLLAQDCVAGMVFLLQKEVVDRLASPPGSGDYGRLSVMVQARCEVTALFTVPAQAFQPPPAVESRLVALRPVAPRVPLAVQPTFSTLVAEAFSHRRKMLRHSLRGHFGPQDWERLGLDATRRPETLTVDEFAALARYAHGQVESSP